MTQVAAFANAVSFSALSDVPTEILSPSGSSLGINNSGSVMTSDVGSVRLNPAMLGIMKDYAVAGSYHWPSAGREFYQVGVVDGKTAPVAAGFLLTGFPEKAFSEKLNGNSVDSGIEQRLSVALAHSFSLFSAGITGSYLSGRQEKDAPLFRAYTLGIGLAGLLTPDIRFGASVENLANSRAKDAAPTIVRFGGAYAMSNGNVVIGLDFRHREPAAAYDGCQIDLTNSSQKCSSLKADQWAFLSGILEVIDEFKVMSSLGSATDGKAQEISGGVGYYGSNASLSYMYQQTRPSRRTHQGVQLEMRVAL